MTIFCTDTPRSNAERLADWRDRLRKHNDKNQCSYHYLQQIEDERNRFDYDCNQKEDKP